MVRMDDDKALSAEYWKMMTRGNFDTELESLNIPCWERHKGEKIPPEGQRVKGKWYVPKYGCDSLELLLDELGFFLEK